MPVPGHRRGLRKLSPDQLAKARDDTADKVGRIMLTFVGTAAFCALSLLSPDSALLGGSRKLDVPLAGPVSFFGFILLGPAVLIALRAYLQINVEHGERLDRLASCMPDVRAPTLLPLNNKLLRWCGWLTFYPLLPLTLMFFAWKAAVFPAWGAGLLCVAVAVSVNQLVLPFQRLSRRTNVLASASAAVMVAVAMLAFGLPRHPFNLIRANLSASYLARVDFRDASLAFANFKGATLIGATLVGADLVGANLGGAKLGNASLRDADLDEAILGGANLFRVSLRGARLSGANLDGADLSAADLRDANMIRAYLNGANLTAATLNGAKLIGANLAGANLIGAHLLAADLSVVDLTGTNLTGADLTGVRLDDQSQLDQACGTPAKLPDGFHPAKLCPQLPQSAPK